MLAVVMGLSAFEHVGSHPTTLEPTLEDVGWGYMGQCGWAMASS